MIKVENLVKAFGTKKAVDGVSFNVERGEILGFLGPNGAGKSTTMRMITGYLPPTSGRVSVGGFDLSESPVEAKRLIGYLPESAPAYSDMTVHGFLSFIAEMRGMRGQAREQAVRRASGMCFLEAVLQQSVDTLSKGYRHRTCLAQSIIHDPDVLVLDEPTDGLDPNQKHEVRQLLKRLGQKKAIIFSTHILEEVDAVCTRAMIIDRGRVVANGTPAELRGRHELASSVSIRFSNGSADAVRSRLETLPHTSKVSVTNHEGQLLARIFPQVGSNPGELVRSVAELASRENWKLEDLRTEEGRLDEVFRSITSTDLAK